MRRLFSNLYQRIPSISQIKSQINPFSIFCSVYGYPLHHRHKRPSIKLHICLLLFEHPQEQRNLSFPCFPAAQYFVDLPDSISRLFILCTQRIVLS